MMIIDFYLKGRYSLKKSTYNYGFTLVEMLSVIAIIAILLSVMLPVLRGASERSKQSACLAHLQQIGYGEFMYAMDNNDFFPDKDAIGGFPFRAAPGYKNPNDKYGFVEKYGLAAVLERYVNYDSSSDIWVCKGQPHTWMRDLGNTYWASLAGKSYTSVKNASTTGIAGDNFIYKPYTPGVRANGVEPGFMIDEDERYQPHSFGLKNGGASILFADCHTSPLKEN